jgi:hypothetical protein
MENMGTFDSGIMQQKRAALLLQKKREREREERERELTMLSSQPQPQPLAQLYRYQKASLTSVDDLKHPIEKYRDLVYRSKEIRFAPEDGHEGTAVTTGVMRRPLLMPPLLASSRGDLTERRPLLQPELKLPTERVSLSFFFIFCKSVAGSIRL